MTPSVKAMLLFVFAGIASACINNPVDERGYSLISSNSKRAHGKHNNASNVFDGEPYSIWDAVTSSGNSWIVWNTNSAIVATVFSYYATGDITHDPQNFTLYYNTTKGWVSAGSFTGASAIDTRQDFVLSTDNKTHKVWNWTITSRYGNASAWVRGAFLWTCVAGPVKPTKATAGCVLQNDDERNYKVLDFNAGFHGVNVTKLFDGNFRTAWDAVDTTRHLDLYNFVTFQTPEPIAPLYFVYLTNGDVVHDPMNFTISYSDDGVKWKGANVNAFTGLATSDIQYATLKLDGHSHEYWKWNITRRYSKSQSFAIEATFITCASNASSTAPVVAASPLVVASTTLKNAGGSKPRSGWTWP